MAERDFVDENLSNFTFEGASYRGVDPLTGTPIQPMLQHLKPLRTSIEQDKVKLAESWLSEESGCS